MYSKDLYINGSVMIYTILQIWHTCIYDTKTSKFWYSAKPDSPCRGFGSHLKNGRYLTISPKLRGVALSLSTRFSGAYISEQVLPNTSRHCIRHCDISCHCIRHLKNMSAKSKVIRLSKKLRGAEPSISTLCLGFVVRILQ